MTFLVWRQYRLQWAIALALLAAFAAVGLIDGFHLAAQWHSLQIACAGSTGRNSGPPCLAQGTVTSVIGNDFRVLSVMVPAILGILWGAPLIAHEMENGTTTFGWTQGITRTRWLVAKMGILLLSAAVWAAAVSALITWWSGPENAQRANAFQPNYFDTQGIVPIGYAVFAMALGITAGVLFRRTFPAIAVTLGGFIEAPPVVRRRHPVTPDDAGHDHHQPDELVVAIGKLLAARLGHPQRGRPGRVWWQRRHAVRRPGRAFHRCPGGLPEGG